MGSLRLDLARYIQGHVSLYSPGQSGQGGKAVYNVGEVRGEDGGQEVGLEGTVAVV